MEHGRCTGSDATSRGSVSLPIVDAAHEPKGKIRHSKNARRRAIVLVVVQVALIAHIVVWALSRQFGWFGGKTVSPIEPSESMEFVKDGVINAGLIFFAVALLSTLLLGRWFCGWGCHVVMLQDGCGWLMKKMGVRPKPFRSRLLIFFPLFLALYMFVWPAAVRWGLIPLDLAMARSLGSDHALVTTMRGAFGTFGVELPRPAVQPWAPELHVATDDFWRTFPGVMVAVPFLLICGFATVYFLGAKGFCTYGCPYGGFFAPLDKFAPGKIRVTDACEHCGHCTAVCTSNVRVHEEVREFGMVVDPGCMKCMDCVSVCPNDALYFGLGKPSVLSGPAKNEKPKKKYDLSWGEEIAIGVLFLATFYAVRGVYDMIPLLMAAGFAGIVAFMAWKTWRLVRDKHVSLHKFQLKYRGSIKRAGWVFAGATVLMLAVTAHCGAVNLFRAIGDRAYEKVTLPPHFVFTDQKVAMPDAMRVDAERAVKFLTLASSVQVGGIGVSNAWQSKIDERLVWLYSAMGDFSAARQCIERSIERDGENESNQAMLFRNQYSDGHYEDATATVLRLAREHPEYVVTLADGVAWLIDQGDIDKAREVADTVLSAQPDGLSELRMHAWVEVATGNIEAGFNEAMRSTILRPDVEPKFHPYRPEPTYVHFMDNIITKLAQMQRFGEALELSRAAMKQFPESLLTMRRLSLLEVHFGNRAEGIALIRKTIEIDPLSIPAHYTLAMSLAEESQYAEAHDWLAKAIEMGSEMGPNGVPSEWYHQMEEICNLLGRDAEARAWAQKAGAPAQ